jgi:hypothetical protein
MKHIGNGPEYNRENYRIYYKEGFTIPPLIDNLDGLLKGTNEEILHTTFIVALYGV